eukprot:m.20221 g.20221  ORF g.20221 m.20221 type:complete len:359 (+) comp27991_c0_seq2:317-1393(+)
MKTAVVLLITASLLATALSRLESEELRGSTFEVVNDEFGGLHLKVLRNTQTGEFVSVIYDFGGRIEDINLLSPKSGHVRPVIWSHSRNATAVRENQSWRGEMLIPYANRISQGTYDFYGVTFHLPINEPDRGNAIHGLIYNQTLAVLLQAATDSSASITLMYTFNDFLPGYPFNLEVKLVYTLSSNGFDFQLFATNREQEHSLPFYAGWHPYFLTTPYKTVVTFTGSASWNQIKVTDTLIPTGVTSPANQFVSGVLIGGTAEEPTAYDDGYKPTEGPSIVPRYETRLRDLSTEETIMMWQDRGFHYIQVYTGARTAFGVNAVAVEPMAGMTDCYNNHDGLIILSGNETWHGAFGVQLE